MAVESNNNSIKQKPDGDKKGTGLTSRMDAVPRELKGIQNVLAQRRIMRDTTNHPSVELARTGRAGAIQRRLKKSKDSHTQSLNVSDSGSPDDAGGDGSGDSGFPGSQS